MRIGGESVDPSLYEINNVPIPTRSIDKDLEILISSDQTWSKTYHSKNIRDLGSIETYLFFDKLYARKEDVIHIPGQISAGLLLRNMEALL